MRLSRPGPWLARLLAVVVALGLAGIGGGRAPSALRIWTDTAAEVVAGDSGRAVDQRSAQPHSARSLARDARPLESAPGEGPRSSAWPQAGSAREILAWKRARLI
jgi:hypothetical protein